MSQNKILASVLPESKMQNKMEFKSRKWKYFSVVMFSIAAALFIYGVLS